MMDIDGGGQIVSMKVSEISKLFYLRRLIFLNEEMGRIHSILQKILLLNLNKIWDYLPFFFSFVGGWVGGLGGGGVWAVDVRWGLGWVEGTN